MTRLLTEPVTADQLYALGPDFHGELVRGRLIEMSPAGWTHGQVAVRVLFMIMKHVDAQRLGIVVTAETGFILEREPDTVRAPDIGFIAATRAVQSKREGFFDGPPDLAVEVLSPSETRREVEEKIADYLRAGSKAVWIVNRNTQTVNVHTVAMPVLELGRNDRLLGGEALPGFACIVEQFFEG